MLSNKEKIQVSRAVDIIESKALVSDLLATSSFAVKSYCQMQIGLSEREKFGVLFLNNQHNLIEFEIMFLGTIDSATIHTREIAKKALKINAVSLVLCHNHPSGSLEASLADKRITTRISEALALLDIRILDHIIVSPSGSMSFTETGLL